jgi:hypothetical protein
MVISQRFPGSRLFYDADEPKILIIDLDGWQLLWQRAADAVQGPLQPSPLHRLLELLDVLSTRKRMRLHVSFPRNRLLRMLDEAILKTMPPGGNAAMPLGSIVQIDGHL